MALLSRLRTILTGNQDDTPAAVGSDSPDARATPALPTEPGLSETDMARATELRASLEDDPNDAAAFAELAELVRRNAAAADPADPLTADSDHHQDPERSADLAGFPLHRQVEGTYAVRFTTTSEADGVLLNMSDSSDPGSALTLRSVGGGVRALVTRNGSTLLDLASGDLGLDDGREHTVALAAGNTTRG